MIAWSGSSMRSLLGTNGDGLIQREQWFPEPGLLERLMERYGIAIFTGRTRDEATCR